MPYVSFSPSTLFSRAMFDFDWSGGSNYRFSGVVNISVSDGFSRAELNAGIIRNDDLTLDPIPSEIDWPQAVKTNIENTFSVISQFSGVQFSRLLDYDSVTGSATNSTLCDPSIVGLSSDINVCLMNANDELLSGLSGGGSDAVLGYFGARGDIFINATGLTFATEGIGFDDFSKSRQVLMHEILHSLGVSHPFSSAGSNLPKPDFSNLVGVGFEKLGFSIRSAADLNKEYFTIMSYDDESRVPYLNAYTPMILDIIALQDVYGEGAGTSGSGNDTVLAGNVGYRSYFDRGGIDTIDASLYSSGAYINLGTTITGASHLVGIVMNISDTSRVLDHADPQSLRWLYGEFENALGSSAPDVIVGNGLNNNISAGGGNDVILAGSGTNYLRGDEGDDSIVGSVGFDDINGNMGNDTCVSGGGDDWVVGGKDNDSVVGGSGQNLVYGNLGNDTCDGGGGNDTVRGGQDNDLVLGGAGNDYISGDKGSDTMTGGAGADIFHSFGDAGLDRVTDFSLSEGDRVQLDAGTVYTVTQVGGDTVINMTGGAQMVLVGVQLSTLSGNWIFGA